MLPGECFTDCVHEILTNGSISRLRSARRSAGSAEETRQNSSVQEIRSGWRLNAERKDSESISGLQRKGSRSKTTEWPDNKLPASNHARSSASQDAHAMRTRRDPISRELRIAAATSSNRCLVGHRKFQPSGGLSVDYSSSQVKCIFFFFSILPRDDAIQSHHRC